VLTTRGCLALIDYRTRHGLKRYQTAQRFGIRENKVDRYEIGDRPGLESAFAIEAGSGGEIDASWWLPEHDTEVDDDEWTKLSKLAP
jgi:transcriptional regulator with XRE-family HTH domain